MVSKEEIRYINETQPGLDLMEGDLSDSDIEVEFKNVLKDFRQEKLEEILDEILDDIQETKTKIKYINSFNYELEHLSNELYNIRDIIPIGTDTDKQLEKDITKIGKSWKKIKSELRLI